jgi:hypothetical protein
VNAGAGSNQIELAPGGSRDKATVAVTAGRNTITGVQGGFDDDTSDVIATDFTNATVTLDENGTLKIKGNGFRAELQDLTPVENVGEGSGTYVQQRFNDGTRDIKAAIALNAETVIDASAGNYFKGNRSGVTFAGVEGDVNVNLSGADWNSQIDGQEAGFSGITNFQAGEGKTTLWSGAANETLSAGNGYASMYGAGGKNVLNGYDNSNGDKDARTTFFVLGNADGAANTINNFAFASSVDSGAADVLEVDTNTNLVSDVQISGNDVIISVTNRAGTATEKARITGALGQNMYVTDKVIAQVDNTNLTYDGQANFFVAKGKNASVKVDNQNTTTAELWLDGKPGNGLGDNFVGDIAVVDASEFDGKAELAGATNTNNTLIGGMGKNSLWGGNGAEGNDLMVGGTGENVFFYTNGNGNDTITGVNAGDVVYLSEVTLEQLSGTSVQNGVATITFKDGGSLTVNDAANATFVMTQGDQSQLYEVNESGFVGKA